MDAGVSVPLGEAKHVVSVPSIRVNGSLNVCRYWSRFRKVLTPVMEVHVSPSCVFRVNSHSRTSKSVLWRSGVVFGGAPLGRCSQFHKFSWNPNQTLSWLITNTKNEMPRFPASLAGTHRSCIPLAPPAPLWTDLLLLTSPTFTLHTMSYVSLCGCAGASSACNRRPGAAVLQIFDSAALSRGCGFRGLVFSCTRSRGARFRFAFGDLYWFHSSPCLLAFMWLVLIGRDLRWILCPISLHQLLGSSLVLWICVCNTHQLCLAVWGHGDRDAVLWKPFTNQKNQSWAQWMSALQTHRVSTQVAEHENQTSPALEACEVSSHGWVCNSEPGGW